MLSIVGMPDGFACPAAGMPGAVGSVSSVAGMPGAAGSVSPVVGMPGAAGSVRSVAGMPSAAGSVRWLNVAKSSNRRFCHTVSRKFSIEVVVF